MFCLSCGRGVGEGVVGAAGQVLRDEERLARRPRDADGLGMVERAEKVGAMRQALHPTRYSLPGNLLARLPIEKIAARPIGLLNDVVGPEVMGQKKILSDADDEVVSDLDLIGKTGVSRAVAGGFAARVDVSEEGVRGHVPAMGLRHRFELARPCQRRQGMLLAYGVDLGVNLACQQGQIERRGVARG